MELKLWRKCMNAEHDATRTRRDHTKIVKRMPTRLTVSTQAVVKVLHADPCKVNGDHSEDQVDNHYQFKGEFEEYELVSCQHVLSLVAPFAVVSPTHRKR